MRLLHDPARGCARGSLFPVITGELKRKVDAIWDAFWSGGIANPLEVMEQITYLLFIRRLDDLHTAAENRANRTGNPIEDPVFPEGDDDSGEAYAELRWSRFKDRDPGEIFATVGERVFPFLRQLGGDGSTYSQHMRDARFTIPTPALLARVVDMLDDMPMEGRDTKGDVYEYMLGKIASAGQNGQFRTPRHVIRLMVEMTAPQPADDICDPACGTGGFLVASGEYLRREFPGLQHEQVARQHFHNTMPSYRRISLGCARRSRPPRPPTSAGPTSTTTTRTPRATSTSTCC